MVLGSQEKHVALVCLDFGVRLYTTSLKPNVTRMVWNQTTPHQFPKASESLAEKKRPKIRCFAAMCTTKMAMSGVSQHLPCTPAAWRGSECSQDLHDPGLLDLLTHTPQAGEEHQVLTNGEDIVEGIVLAISKLKCHA